MRNAVAGDLALAHRLEHRALGTRRGPVDLVGKEDIGEDRAGDEREPLLLGVEQTPSRDIGGDQVAGELDSVEPAVERLGQRPGQKGLADPRDILQKEVPSGQERREKQVDRFTLAEDDRLDVGFQCGDFFLHRGYSPYRSKKRGAFAAPRRRKVG